jgi:hypothetical protein
MNSVNPALVCPGCYAIGSEPHAGYCLDVIADRERVLAEDEGYEPDDLNDSNDWECEP